MANWETCAAAEGDPQKVSGAWVFVGTLVVTVEEDEFGVPSLVRYRLER